MTLQVEKHPITLTAHGHERIDEYAWIRAENWRDVLADPAQLHPKIRAHLEAENAHFSAYMDQNEALKHKLFQELKGRIQERDETPPTKNATHVYWSRFEEGKEYGILMRAPFDTPEAGAVVWDANKAVEGASYYRLGVAVADPQDFRMIIGEDTTGSEQYDLRILDLESGEFLPDLIPATGGGGVWDAVGESFFYLRLDDHHRPYQVRRHILGQDPAQDQIVYQESNPAFFVDLSKTESDAFITIQTGDNITSEIHLLPADQPDADLQLVSERQEGHEYELTHEGDWFYILTNRGGEAVDFEIVKAPVANPEPENWTPIIDHRPGRLILSIFTTQGYLMRLERVRALPQLVIIDIATGTERLVEMEGAAYALSAGPASGDFADQLVRFTYSSPTTAASVFDLDLTTGVRTLRKVQEVPSGHDPNVYEVLRHEVVARDDARIPLTILKRRDLTKPAPALVYGYGSYGLAIPAGFSTHALSLVDRGMIYAIAHIRGGMEQGYAWYLDGKLEKKQNTFNDFEDCVRYLIDQGFSSAGKIAIEGGSAGGLLVGAVMNQAPELFGAVVAQVPFVDVVTTISDATLPLTPMEWNEWGNPIEDPAAYETIYAYSPYDQVRAQDYPPLLATAGLSDPRVTYWEPAKWVARLRDRRTNDQTLICKINMEAGHGGRSGRFEYLWEKAESYTFILNELGLTDSF